MHESEKWKWSRLVVSDCSDPMDQPTRLIWSDLNTANVKQHCFIKQTVKHHGESNWMIKQPIRSQFWEWSTEYLERMVMNWVAEKLVGPGNWDHGGRGRRSQEWCLDMNNGVNGGTLHWETKHLKKEKLRGRKRTEFLKKLFMFYWKIIALQNFAVLCQTSTWISHRYTYVPSLLNLPFISLPILPLQVDIEPL